MNDPTLRHYEERMQEDLDEIRHKVRKIANRIENQVGDAVHALLENDRDLANQVILGDRRVNRQIREIDHLAHAFIVRHAPSAGHLRYVSAVLRLNVALERVGDYAGAVGREVVQMGSPPADQVARDIELISHQGRRTLRQALAAFQEGDADLARDAYGMAGQTDSTLQKVFADLLAVGESKGATLRDMFGLLRIINLLKRVAEQAENICEQAIFAATGETKDPRVFRILFLSKRNNGVSQMAEAYAQKAFPESGIYASAGWEPAEEEELNSRLLEFMDRKGIDMRGKKPTMLRPIHEEPRHWNVVVGLHPDARDHIPNLPFRTVFLDWTTDLDVNTLPENMTEEQMDTRLKALAMRIRDLMVTLRGPDAS